MIAKFGEERREYSCFAQEIFASRIYFACLTRNLQKNLNLDKTEQIQSIYNVQWTALDLRNLAVVSASRICLAV